MCPRYGSPKGRRDSEACTAGSLLSTTAQCLEVLLVAQAQRVLCDRARGLAGSEDERAGLVMIAGVGWNGFVVKRARCHDSERQTVQWKAADGRIQTREEQADDDETGLPGTLLPRFGRTVML